MNVPNQFLLITDLDNTLVGDDIATKKLNQYLCSHRQNFVVVYATGRSYSSAKQLMIDRELIEPNYWITGVGTEIYYQDRLDFYWANKISADWQRESIESFVTSRFPQLKLQVKEEQNPWKLSFDLLGSVTESISQLQAVGKINRGYVECLANVHSVTLTTSDHPKNGTIDQLVNGLQAMKLKAQVIFSSNVDVDILPINANKGNAVQYIQHQLGITADRTLVCGDSGNDISMFQQPVFGVIVNNAQLELIEWYQAHADKNHYFAKNAYANGILEALQRFNFVLE
ncbi:MAG: sucrose-phosphate phosphatase [Pseudanabaena frigida]|uniref:Sucrose-phosphate phosphatase n=1 Tax=Pseudanabaena frigida TaxID=945775 RepID=A0A2W4YEE4_9CYAN|nr:MAG: sucrose-phosphate phosphatase [Pseudanabaena frigida]